MKAPTNFVKPQELFQKEYRPHQLVQEYRYHINFIAVLNKLFDQELFDYLQI